MHRLVEEMSITNNGLPPASNTPSIVQIRMMLIGLVMVISAVVWWQSAGGNTNHAVQKYSKTPLPDAVTQMYFADAEASWSDLRIDPQGNLLIDAHTEAALSETIDLMTNQAVEPQTARIALLMKKQVGATSGQQFVELLPILINYKEIEQLWWEEHGSRQPPPHAKLFALQDELLGEALAQEMFSEQRRIVEMMLASYDIQNDASLTQAEKDQALIDLQETFQDEDEPID